MSPNTDPATLTIHELRERLRTGATSSEAVTAAYLSRIDRIDGELHSFVLVDREGAMEQARQADAARAAGADDPLLGVPIGLKDLIATQGMATTCASKILAGFVPPYDATVVRRLRQAGAVILGKNNMDEFAMGSSCETSAYGPTKNPWDVTKIPGGSSGGSAAAVAADLCAASIGSDTGGSIRQPASLCGIVGLKPTYGRVSRFGLVAFASSLDQLGPMTKDVRDAALLLSVMAGHDRMDSTSAPVPVPDYLAGLEKGAEGLTVGIPAEYFGEGIDPEVEEAIRAAAARLTEAGALVREVSLPHTKYAVPTYYVLAPAEASSNLARFDGVRYGVRADDGGEGLTAMYTRTRERGFGPEVLRRIMLGTYALSSGYYDAYYLKAQKVRTLIKRDFDAAFAGGVDVLLTPTSPTAAFGIGEKADDPITMYLSDIFTINCNLAGVPGISVPCGMTAAGLPIGVQLMAAPFAEGTLLRAARAVETTAGFLGKRPALA